eukprot:CAMPEP_0174261640 /NCGR_PEP_ID=MMETSP0439-20130205/11684_1 /TAXON_ID=0 /ORGANISM="Stereomyxa ramosa, Strain Chinc5" /LENGTH=198 /DNA_ID=CAMNT_0015346147 /DNA_START=92 /DNA_END=688 /DNA_ORIENTATION=+
MVSKMFKFKLVLLGEAGVGKSNLVLRFAKNQFNEHNESTIGAAFLTQTVALPSEHIVKFEIWDTAGQERFRSLAPMYYRGAEAAVVVYDITNPMSFNRAKQWVRELQTQGSPEMIIALAGNKCDLENQRQVSPSEGAAFADDNGMLFMETSAKTGDKVVPLFEKIAKMLPTNQGEAPRESNGLVVQYSDSSSTESSCC